MRYIPSAVRLFAASLLLAAPLLSAPFHSSEPHWIRLDSSHFSVLTDADQIKAHEVAARFEQMRALFALLLMKTRVNIPEPIEIIAFKNAEDYNKVAPAKTGEGLGAAFYLPGDGRNYFVLNLAQEDSYRAISYDFARLLLNFNYPPTQPWFDEGFAEYFASAKLGDQNMQIGTDPEAHGNAAVGAKSFVEILNSSTWQALPELFAAKLSADANRHTLFSAQSWLVMEYLIANDKLSNAGTYFGLVETDKLPIEDAIQKAFGMNSDQLGKAIKDYFQSLLEMLQSLNNPHVKQVPMPAPVAADQVGSSVHDVPLPTAQALVAEMALRVPEHREQARQELESLITGEKTETAIDHRALGWYYLNKKDFEKTSDELTKALVIDGKDTWTHFYLALYKERQAKASRQATQGLANMIQDLHAVLDWYPEFAQAYAMLAKAQLEGGGVHSATDSMRAAIKLSPRNQDYLLEMAQVYSAGKNWEAANAMLQMLSASSDPHIADAAREQLTALPYLKKYGITPQQTAAQTPPKPGSSPASPPAPPPSQKTSSAAPQPAQESDDEKTEEPPAEPQIDRRPIQYLKGKLVSVDCSQPPVGVITISTAAKNMKLRTADYKALTLIGADNFSCDWKNQNVSVNYKPGGKADGDLVSLELK